MVTSPATWTRPGGGQGLHGDPGLGVLGQQGVEDRIADLVADLVRMALGHRLGREEPERKADVYPWKSGMCSGKVTQLPYWLENGGPAACVPVLQETLHCYAGLRLGGTTRLSSALTRSIDGGRDVGTWSRAASLRVRQPAPGQDDHGVVCPGRRPCPRPRWLTTSRSQPLRSQLGLGVVQHVAAGVAGLGGEADNQLVPRLRRRGPARAPRRMSGLRTSVMTGRRRRRAS